MAASATTAMAGKADVVSATASMSGNGMWSFAVTVRHADAGWKHYADNYEVLEPDGTLLGRRVLAHPHVNEQPFTRSLGGVKIPARVKKVHIRAHDMVHGFGGREIDLMLPR
jgi:hypothetical protein